MSIYPAKHSLRCFASVAALSPEGGGAVPIGV